MSTSVECGTVDTCRNMQVYDFPKLSTIINNLYYEFKGYKYTVYRCAAKIVKLQKVFNTSDIPYKLILAVLDRHGLNNGDMNLMVPPFQLTSLIHDIYFACEKLGQFTKTPCYSLESATAVLSNFFWNIFDPHRRHSISLLEIKITFLLFSKLYASDQMINEFYNTLCNVKTKCVPKLNFCYMLNILSKIFSYVGESSAYGAQNTPLMMDQCYARCNNYSGLTDNQFHCLWSSTQTQFLIYANLMALIIRMKDTEKLIHPNICASCSMDKIIGIRFKCQTCKDLSLCLKCFAAGYCTNKHSSGHRMYEIYTEDAPAKKFSHYFEKLCVIFCCRDKMVNEDTEDFVNNTMTQTHDTELMTITSNNRTSNASTVSVKSAPLKHSAQYSIERQSSSLPDKSEMDQKEKIDASLACLTTTASNASHISGKLQILIDKLLLQNMKLEEQLRLVKTSSPNEISNFLINHQKFLSDMIQDMRNVSASSDSISMHPTSSTPNRSILPTTLTDIDNFSDVLNTQTNVYYSHGKTIFTPRDNLTHSLNGAEINRSYLDANKSDYSINDLSLWFNHRRMTSIPAISFTTVPHPLSVLAEVASQDETNCTDTIGGTRDTEMQNFKLLLHKVKEIVEDSYSDNTELSEATQNLENVLDSMIKAEEGRRKSLN